MRSIKPAYIRYVEELYASPNRRCCLVRGVGTNLGSERVNP